MYVCSLVCTVNYVKHDGEKKYFRKFFKFQVMNPISIKTQTHDLQVIYLSLYILYPLSTSKPISISIYISYLFLHPISIF